MSKKVKTVDEMEPGEIPGDSTSAVVDSHRVSGPIDPDKYKNKYPPGDTQEDTQEDGYHDEITEISYTDAKGIAWRRLMLVRYAKAVKVLEQIARLGVWNNYHYTQHEVGVVVRKLTALVLKIQRAHAPREVCEESPLAMPWEE